MATVENKVCLIVLDGWGVTTPSESNANFCAPTPGMTALAERSLATTVQAHGLAVGLPDGIMGNSEVGHLTIGAGRIDFQARPLTRTMRRLAHDSDGVRSLIAWQHRFQCLYRMSLTQLLTF